MLCHRRCPNSTTNTHLFIAALAAVAKEGPECVYITYSTAAACVAGNETCGEVGGGLRDRETDVQF